MKYLNFTICLLVIASALLTSSVFAQSEEIKSKEALSIQNVDTEAVDAVEIFDNQALSFTEVYDKFFSLKQRKFICGTTINDRDNNVYTTVQVGGQCWLGSNLKTKTGPDNVLLTTGTDNSQRDCITTSNTRGTEADCDARGALYTSGTAATICPSGWHLPSDDEFAVMEQSVTGSGQSCSSERGVIIPSDMLGCPGTLPADSCSPAGYALKVGGNSGFNWTQIGYRKANRSKIAPYNVSVSFVDANTTGYLMTSKTGTCGLFGNVGAYPQTNNVVYRSISNASKGVIRKSEVSYSVNGEGDATVSTALPVRCILGN